MAERYIGIENELISFNGSRVDFGKYFKWFRGQFNDIYCISDTSIRTDNGNGFYVDINEIEILTPPISINKGFSSRLTDSLVIGRNKILDAIPNLEQTGYSMHWNISKENKDRNYFYNGIAVPFQLFALTPLSTGFNLRVKPGRYELLGDSINNPEQINAAALLFGAYSLAIEENKKFPWNISNLESERNNLLIGDGRYDFVEGNFGKNGRIIQVQQYLEGFYHWLEPTIKKLGTKRELQNLEGFVFGDKELEFDNFRYFAKLHDLYKKEGGVFLPFKDNENSGTLLRKQKAGKIPLEAKLLGEIIKKEKNLLNYISWERLGFSHGRDINGIKNIYKYAEKLNKENGCFKLAIENVKVNNLDDFVLPGEISYKFPDKTNSPNLFYKGKNAMICLGKFFKDVGNSFGEKWVGFWENFEEGYLTLGFLAILVGLAAGAAVGATKNKSKINNLYDKIIENYSFPKQDLKDTLKLEFLEEEIKNGQ